MKLTAPDPESMRNIAKYTVAPHLRAGDLVILAGDLGAGKTTFTQGLGEALGVRGPVASPTFIIARTHPSLTDGPPLIHVDAYRLGGLAELDDLDLDATLADAITVVEWGEGTAEALSESRLHIEINRERGGAVADRGIDMNDPQGGPRVVSIRTEGPRWRGISLAAAEA